MHVNVHVEPHSWETARGIQPNDQRIFSYNWKSFDTKIHICSHITGNCCCHQRHTLKWCSAPRRCCGCPFFETIIKRLHSINISHAPRHPIHSHLVWVFEQSRHPGVLRGSLSCNSIPLHLNLHIKYEYHLGRYLVSWGSSKLKLAHISIIVHRVNIGFLGKPNSQRIEICSSRVI